MAAHRSRMNEILANAELIVGYNSDHFDLKFLRSVGIKIPEIPTYDVMLEFAPDLRTMEPLLQKLATCADYYGYEAKGNFHDSLEDVRATLYCFYAMIKEEKR